MPTQWCHKCDRKFREEAPLLACPECGGPLSGSPKEGELTPEQRREIKRLIWEVIGIRVTVVGIIGFLSLIFLYFRGIRAVNNAVLSRVDTEFKTDRIRSTVEQVASNQAVQLLEVGVRPEVKKFQAEVKDALAEVRRTIRQLDVRYRVTLSGEWTTKGFQRPPFQFAQDIPFLVVSSKNDTNRKPVKFFEVGYDAKDTDDGGVITEAWASVRSGEFPLGQKIDELLSGYDSCSLVVPLINKTKTKSETVNVESVEIEFSVNGEIRGAWRTVERLQFPVGEANVFRRVEAIGTNVFNGLK